MKKKITLAMILIFTAFGISVQAAWYDAELAECKSRGFVSSELFESPEEYITRAEVCDLLVSYYEHKNSNQNIAIKSNSFTDISSSEYEKAIEKAYSLGFINGMTNTEFAPDENITREQFVCLIYRMNGSPLAENFIYDDKDEISEYALSAIDYCVANKIVTGTSKGYFSPKANITKAQAIVIVKRLDDNSDLKNSEPFSKYLLKSETPNHISYITRKFDRISYQLMYNRGLPMDSIPKDVLVILDKKTEQRKLIELDKAVSLHFFDDGDTLYIPICRVTSNGLQDSWTQGMYVVDKNTGSVREEETPIFGEAFALANGCVYYETNVKTGERSIRPTISKYNLKTKQVTMSSQGAIGEFDGNTILYLDENEAVCKRCVNNETSVYTIDLNTLEMKLISNEQIIAANEKYLVILTEQDKPIVGLYERKTNQIIKTVNIADVLNLVTESDISLATSNSLLYYNDLNSLFNFTFYDVNGDLYLRYQSQRYAKCITNTDAFDMDFFYCFFDFGYAPNNLYQRKDKAFFIANPNHSMFSAGAPIDTPTEDAAVSSLYSRKTYGVDKDLNSLVYASEEIRKFCVKYKKEYKNPYDLIRALNDYLTFECTYDHATYAGLPTDRKYSPYTAAGLIVEKSGVCGGYADTVQRVLSYAGIKCKVISGIANNDSHAWNMIELDGTKYYLDATWNSCHRNPDDYYLISFEQMALDHELDEDYRYLID